MDAAHPPIERVAIAGGGTAGWMAAALLAKTLGRRLQICLVESAEIGSVGVGEASIPPIRVFNDALGLDEHDLLRRTGGTYKLGIQFRGWGRPGDCYMHAFGEIGRDLGMGQFHQYWLRSRREGNADRLWDYSVNETAALAGRFDPAKTLPESPLAGLEYAFHFDASRYARCLRTYSEQLGVQRIEGKIRNLERRPADGLILALALEDGRRISGDLFLDCTGFRALLLGETLGVGFQDWSRWLPCDRALALPCAAPRPWLPYTQAIARSAGWQWRIPLQHRLGSGYVYCSRHLSDDAAAAELLGHLEGPALAEPRLLKFAAGRRETFWQGNCVALGLAAGFLEPVESTSIHLIQSGISRLVHLFPDQGFAQATMDEYNRQSLFEFDRIRDFLILHYKATQRDDAPFWRECASMAVPESLQHRLALFQAAGRVYRDLGELFTEAAWLQVMLGQNVQPRSHHPIADALSQEQLRQYMRDLKTIIRGAVARMPGHEAYIQAQCAAKAEDA